MLWGKIPEFYLNPLPTFEYFNIPLFGPRTLGILGFIWLTSLLFSAVGLFTRLSTIVAFLLGTYLISLTKCYGRPSHTEFVLIIVLAVMAVSHCGDGFSLDSWLRNRGWLSPIKKRESEGEYRWPIRLIWVFMTLVFCAAGLSKLRASGLEWVTSGTIATFLNWNGFRGNRMDPLNTGLTFWVASKPYLYYSMAAATIILEVGAPLALLSSYLRAVFIPLLFLMVLSFWILMGIHFPDLLAAFVFWVPWDTIAKRLNLV